MSAAAVLALGHARDVATLTARVAGLRAAMALREAGVDVAFEEMVRAARSRSRITVHFHPERLLPNGDTVARCLATEGWYRNQFETGITNAGVPARAEGLRDRLERELFADAYARPGVLPAERPKYGALDLLGLPEGGAPEFGPCHLRLRPLVAPRCTFSNADGDRVRDTGTWNCPDTVIAGLLENASAAGRDAVGDLVRTLMGKTAAYARPGEPCSTNPTLPALPRPVGRRSEPFEAAFPVPRVDAQIHGELLISRDVDRLVVDPSYRGTGVEEDLLLIRDRYEVELHWHRGFALPFENLQSLCGDSMMAVLARQIHREFALDDAPLTAAMIGRAATEIHTDPRCWADWGSTAHVLTLLRQLWRVVVRHGHPID